jgi:hypothetical protein
MSETATAAPVRPAEVLITLLVTLLAPMFVGASGGDIVLARLAAIETINDYRARNHADLIAVAQIIGFGLAALGSLSLSMAGDVPLSLTLRLRGNANACTRSAEHNRRAIREYRDDPPIHESWFAEPELGQNEFESFLSPDAERLLAAESAARLHQAQPPGPQAPAAAFGISQQADLRAQAAATIRQALKLDASIPHLPPAEQTQARHRLAELNSIVNQLIAGLDPPPASFGTPRPPTAHR